MNYIRSISGSVSSTWNSINPATLSGAIDVIVVEQEDGSLACSPFHIRFGKFSLLRPYEKKVEFTVNGEKRDFPMKLGEGGEAFFVFETQDSVPEALQTSPPVSPAASPTLAASESVPATPALQEPDPFDLEPPINLDQSRRHGRSTTEGVNINISTPIPIPTATHARRAQSDAGQLESTASTPPAPQSARRFSQGTFAEFGQHAVPKLERQASDSDIPAVRAAIEKHIETSELLLAAGPVTPPSTSTSAVRNDSDYTPPQDQTQEQAEARSRAMGLSKKLWSSNISNQVTDSGDLMLDMTAYKSGNMEALQAEGIARQLLSEELDGPYDIGALIGADEKGNIWIYSSEEAKEAANKRAAGMGGFLPAGYASTDALSDPGYHSDDAQSSDSKDYMHSRRDSDSAVGLPSQPSSPGVAGDPNKNYAKTLRLTSDQLKTMNLKSGGNTMSFTVNRATCNATLWYWQHDVPIVISDIDGTITKSDVLGHVLNTLGRDWTHAGVAKLYTEIASNGYNFLYLTSRSVGQADNTRAYLKGVLQEGYKLPPGPVILSPDRTMAALRREVYLRKPEIFKMACLRDIMALFAGHGGANNVTETAVEAGLKPLPGKAKSGSPFYAGFGNRLTDALSYRSVNIPSTRIFTINSNSEISLDLLSLNNYKTGYSTMREIVDHYFPPVGLLVKGGGEEFTDFNYWRERPLDVADFTDSDDEDEAPIGDALKRLDGGGLVDTRGEGSVLSEDEMGDSLYISDAGRPSLDQSIAESFGEEYEEGYEDEAESELELEEEEEAEEDGGVEVVLPRTPQLSPAEVVSEERTPRRGDGESPGKLAGRLAEGLGLGGGQEGWKK